MVRESRPSSSASVDACKEGTGCIAIPGNLHHGLVRQGKHKVRIYVQKTLYQNS
jgi:hypothetical protein